MIGNGFGLYIPQRKTTNVVIAKEKVRMQRSHFTTFMYQFYVVKD